jgi:hypothetical protein
LSIILMKFQLSKVPSPVAACPCDQADDRVWTFPSAALRVHLYGNFDSIFIGKAVRAEPRLKLG